MKLSKTLNLLLPTVQYGNVSIGVSAEVDTDNPEDLKVLGLKSSAKSDEISTGLVQFVENELFLTKDSLEERPKKDFTLSTR